MIAIAIGAVVIIGILLFMVWGDDGPVWKNFLTQACVGLLIAAVIGAMAWVGTYGN